MAFEVTNPKGEVWLVEFRADVTVVCCDPEMADYSNPRGEIYGDRFFLRVSNGLGQAYTTRYYPDHYKTMESAAHRLALLIEAGTVNPHSNAKLHLDSPVYGSRKWAEHGEADELMWEKKERQMEGF